MELSFAMAGNPNAGKTTLFNELTGAHQHVGNYPGVTVEKKQGSYVFDNTTINIVDLPGTYSLTAYSQEELVARDFLVNEKPSVVINIIDASNLERNLYLTIQFLELGIPVCIALNMMDVAKSRGIKIDVAQLSEAINVPVIPTIARKGKGKTELMNAAVKLANETHTGESLNISYGNDIDPVLWEMEDLIKHNQFLTHTYPARWTALKMLEKDEQVLELGATENKTLTQKLKKIADKLDKHLELTMDTYAEAQIADYRYGFIKSILKQNVVIYQTDQDRLFLSDRIDKVLTNRFLGPIIMIGVIIALYQFTFTYSEMPVGWFESFFSWLGEKVSNNLPQGMLQSLIVSGIIDGVGGVLGFVPLIVFMFFGISILEDSGYLARVAYMLDRVFRVFGLHGSSVMPFIVSGGIAGGCAVPGIMATRTLKSPRERMATLLTVPFMNCGAKMPIYALLVAAFFSKNEANVMLIITFISWSGALLVAKVLRSTIIPGASTPFVMELPPYRFPTFKGLCIHTWERTWEYIKKAGTIILAISILLWTLMTFPGLSEQQIQTFENKRNALKATVSVSVINELSMREPDLSDAAKELKDQLRAIDSEESEKALRNSIAGRIGIALESITQFAGFDWRTNIALLGGFAAKEVIVSTLGTAYSLGEIDPEENQSLARHLQKSSAWNPAVAWSIIIFIIFYAPCFVSVICIAKESGSWKWGMFSMIFNTLLAFFLAVIVFQVGNSIF
jgi:ferrous iron transport protein B